MTPPSSKSADASDWRKRARRWFTKGVLRVVGRRVDKLVFGYRVAIDPSFLAYLRKQARVAREHGRAEIQWRVMMPTYKGARAPESGKFRKLGPSRPGAWARDPLLTTSEPRRVMWGELRYSRSENKFIITNDPYFIIAIDPYAAGGDVGNKSERKEEPERVNVRMSAAVEKQLGENRMREGHDRGEPGFTVEVSVYAQHLARVGLVDAERESEEIAWMIGEVREKRLRRIDLCADVAEMTLREDDTSCLVKRSRAAWVKNFADGSWSDSRGETSFPDEHGATDTHGREGAKATLVRASGPMLRKPASRRRYKYVPPVAARAARMTGLSVGRGGAMMMRAYDKREELARADDRAAERREVEEAIWKSNGWDGMGPVCRVEFQIRGDAIRELGLRDPDCMKSVERDDEGNPIAHVVEMVKDAETGKMRKATLADWLDRLWLTCVRWCRFIVPAVTKNGKPLQADRCELDPRWEILHTVTFTKTFAMPLERFRARGAASAAQSLGCAISQAAREGQLPKRWETSAEWYERYTDPHALLRERVRLLLRDVEERCVAALVAKWKDPVRANVHLAERANAARARHMREGLVFEPSGPRVVGADYKIASGMFTMHLDAPRSIVAA